MPNPIRNVIVLGAGIAGLACASELVQADIAVTLLDKGRRPGGRVATRRLDGVSFNHGAQYATARGPAFAALLDELQAERRAAPWIAAGADGRRMVFLPGMSALPAAMAERAMARGADIRMDRHAAYLHPDPMGWMVRHLPAADIRPGATACAGGDLTGPYDAVLLALPASQAAALLATASHPFAAVASRAEIAPCWAVLACFPDPVPGLDVLQPDNGPIAWAAREGSRPGQPPGPDAWTLHAGAGWSRAHLDDPPVAVGTALIEAFRGLAQAPEPGMVQAHRWRHALVETAVGQPNLWDPVRRVGVCGDWCLGGRIEAAYDSGISLARAVRACR